MHQNESTSLYTTLMSYGYGARSKV